jgi:hypothetical protein
MSNEPSPWDFGFKARQRGEDQTANPYPPGSEQHARWVAGWVDLDEHFAARDSVFGDW